MDARLTLLTGPLSGQTIRVPRKLLIGRSEDCDLRLESELVSSYHAVLLLDDFTLRLRDLGSKNGTYLNGRRIGGQILILVDGDTLSVAEMSFLVALSTEKGQRKSTESRTLPKPAQGSQPSLQRVLSGDGEMLNAEPPPVPLRHPF